MRRPRLLNPRVVNREGEEGGQWWSWRGSNQNQPVERDRGIKFKMSSLNSVVLTSGVHLLRGPLRVELRRIVCFLIKNYARQKSVLVRMRGDPKHRMKSLIMFPLQLHLEKASLRGQAICCHGYLSRKRN